MLFTMEKLKEAARIKHVDISESELKDLYEKLQTNSYIPEPPEKIDLKTNDKIRPITISQEKDKLVQYIINKYLNEQFNHTFSDKSYAYRPNKGPLKAINRVTDFIKRGDRFVLKTDIKDFFETIDHDLLVSMLKEKIKDENLIDLIMMYLKIGAVRNLNYEEHELGVYQGNIISPVLSNIYLDKMDKFLEKHGFDFVRFADDFVILAKSRERIDFINRNLRRFLKVYKLSLNDDKTYKTSVDSGFSFLGVYFTAKFRTINKDRVKRIRNKITSYTNLSFNDYLTKMNTYYNTLKNYYLKISPHNKFIKSAVMDATVRAIIKAKKRGEIKHKSDFKEKLNNILFFNIFLNKQKAVDIALNKAYNRLNNVQQKIEKKKKEIEKRLAVSSVIHIDQPGVSVGISKSKITVKRKRKIIKAFPVNKVKRVVLEGRRFSLSGLFIETCAKKKIFVDFIDFRLNPYASITFYNASIPQIIHKQAMILNSPKQLELAKAFIYGKLKNQRNYLRYLNKYHKTLDKNIGKIQDLIDKVKYASSIESLMGIEGSSSSIYWSSLSEVSKISFKRITKGAKDEINSALNYGYAILYDKVQEALIRAGLSLHISFLHALDSNKPTLVFDLIEEFRTFVVDRTIFSMINKNEEIKVDNSGYLTLKSKRAIAENIYERLGSYTTYRKQSRKLENIIYEQALCLKEAILNDKKYKPFIGRY